MVYGEYSGEYARAVAVGKHIRAVREGLHMTQEMLAAKTGVKQAHISKWENDRQNPSVRSAQKLADGTGVPVDVWLGRTTPRDRRPSLDLLAAGMSAEDFADALMYVQRLAGRGTTARSVAGSPPRAPRFADQTGKGKR
jgi:transcriptional regulator with XRE-family HTH domain